MNILKYPVSPWLRASLGLFCLGLSVWLSACIDTALGQSAQLDEAKQKWREYLRCFPNVEGAQSDTFTYLDGKADLVYKRKFICAYPKVYLRSESNGGDLGHIEANEKYQFSLDDPLKDGTATINDLFLLGDIPQLDAWTFPENMRNVNRNSSVNLIAEMVAPGLLLSHKWLPVLTESPDFVLESFKENIQDGERVVNIKFTNKPKVQNYEASLMNVRHGEVMLLPDHYWLIKEGTCFFWSDDSYTTRWKNEYSFEKFAVPVIQERQLETFFESGLPGLRRHIVYEYLPFDNVSQKKFALSDYSLPEPDFGERRVSPFSYALFVIGVLMIAYALWRLYRNREGAKG